MDERLERAAALYERAVFGGDRDAVAAAERELDGVEADLALARGRILHARFLEQREEDPRELELFERAAELYRRLENVRGEAQARFGIGIVHQVVRGDGDAALPSFEKADELARQAEDKLTISYVVRHLAFADMAAGRMDTARERFEESVRLRREVGFLPGVAAGLLALAELADEIGQKDEARVLLDEAAAVAESSGAFGILHWIEEARSAL
jgi:tetratricopeptide (TPR) repeat protein